MFNKCTVTAYQMNYLGRKEFVVKNGSAEIWTTDKGIFLWRLGPQAFKKVIWGLPKRGVPAEFIILKTDFYYSIMMEACRIQSPRNETDPQRLVKYQLVIDRFKGGSD